jgi:hypothetical protein
MNPGFKLRFAQMREGDPTAKDVDAKTEDSDDTATPEQADQNQFYQQPGHMRNVCFVWPDGRRLFLGYAYLVSGELKVDGEMNEITLTLSSQTLTIKGYRLEDLYNAIMEQGYCLWKLLMKDTLETWPFKTVASCAPESITLKFVNEVKYL